MLELLTKPLNRKLGFENSIGFCELEVVDSRWHLTEINLEFSAVVCELPLDTIANCLSEVIENR